VTVNDQRLAERFESERARLLAVAYRLLGSASEADDAVQESWLRLNRADTSDVQNLSAWLTTVTARVCLDMLRSRRSRREVPEAPATESISEAANPEREAMLAESVGSAMVAVLQRLAPAERVAFVLHDIFGVSFQEIASIVDRSTVATRKLASRARQRVQEGVDAGHTEDVALQRFIVEAFLRASRDGDFQGLLAVLDPDVALRGDETALRMGSRSGWLPSELRGAKAVAKQFDGRAEAAQLALINGTPGAVWAPGGTPRVVFGFTIRRGQVSEIELVADTAKISQLTIEILA
jgi:RNA polymerase sigma factor (sigma-70 family)